MWNYAAILGVKQRVRRLGQGPLAIGMSVILASGCGASSARIEATISKTSSTYDSASTVPGFREVALGSVEVTVPSTWPLEDGSHTPTCSSDWPVHATVFIGDQPIQGMSCPVQAPSSVPPPQLNGIWMQQESGTSPNLVTVTLPGGQVVREYPSAAQVWGTTVFFHGVSLLVGADTSSALTRSILDSLTYDPAIRTTPVPGACDRVPPQLSLEGRRLTHRLVLDHGDIVLDPPLPSDRPATPPPKTSGQDPASPTTETADLYLVRFSAAYPARTGPDGKLDPLNTNVLAWVIYSQPITTSVPGCGLWGVQVTSAQSGSAIEGSGWQPGP